MTPSISRDTASRALYVASAFASEVNDELTIIVNCAEELDMFEAASEIRAAAQRIAWKASDVLRYADRRGVRRCRGPMERYIVENL